MVLSIHERDFTVSIDQHHSQGRWQGVTPLTKLRGPQAQGGPNGYQGAL